MGEFGRKIVREDVVAVRRGLVRAFSDEWLAHYDVRFVGGALRGNRARDVVDAVRAEQEIERLIDDAAPGMAGR